MRLPMVSQLELLLLAAASLSASLPHDSASLELESHSKPDPVSSTGRKLRGRFLHITDFHPDPFYKQYSDTNAESACHRGIGPSGFYGAETTDCDSPIALINATFQWIDENIQDEIDFIVWTGDSARHDNDELLPRDREQVVEQNRLLVSKFTEVWGRKEKDGGGFKVPIIPTFGNNDILPHNIFEQGPNYWTNTFLDVWRDFIPEEQRHQFQRGGWFSVEVIPNELAVISLNTMYFFDNNFAVDGCAKRSEPGYEHFEWLRVQLQMLRERGMKAILLGHVPPARTENKNSWDETCWQKYTLWMRQYRDVVVSSMYGHMNVAHFMLQDFEEIDMEVLEGRVVNTQRTPMDDEITIESATDYLLDLRDQWSKLPAPQRSTSTSLLDAGRHRITALWAWAWNYDLLPSEHNIQQKQHKDPREPSYSKIGGKWVERYSHTFVQASIVPNYFPTMRIFDYNITDLRKKNVRSNEHRAIPQIPLYIQDDPELETVTKHKLKVPDGPSKSSPPGPAYSPQPLSLISYVQYFANLTHINNDFTEDDPVDDLRWKDGKHHGKHPKKGKPRKFKFEVEYDTRDDKNFGLDDLTMKSWHRLARRIGQYNTTTVGDDAESDHFDREDIARLEDNVSMLASDDLDADQHKKHKHKKHKHRKHHGKGTKQWLAFVRRAFVETMDPKAIEESFMRSNKGTAGNERPQEDTELR